MAFQPKKEAPAITDEIAEGEVEVSPSVKISVRTQKIGGNPRVDARTVLNTQRYKGFTKKGLNLPPQQAIEVGLLLVKAGNRLMKQSK